MDTFANKSEQDKQMYYEFTADKKGLPKNIIEKDFWVCWTLKQLFNLPRIGEHLTFKGGTSLSKAYQLIERFSEDIDISIDKKYLGFIEDRDPDNVLSKKKQQKLIKELADACAFFVRDILKNDLNSTFSKALSFVEAEWSIEVDSADIDGQTLLFYYPTLTSTIIDTYIRPSIKIELGARGAGNPFNICKISPFIPTTTALTGISLSLCSVACLAK